MKDYKLEEIGEKVDMLLEAITNADLEGRKEEFAEKWKDRIAEVEADQKAVYGDNWSEVDGLFDYHNSHMDDEGYDEDKVMNGYFDELKSKFAKLRGQATTEEAKEAIDEAETKVDALQSAAENADTPKEAAEITMEADNVVDKVEEEVKEEESKKTILSEDQQKEVEEALKGDILLSL